MSDTALPSLPPPRAGLLDEYWYYTVEYDPGRFTPGMQYGNVALTRGLMRRIELTGARCLDIGAMEGVVATLMVRRGAKDVLAFDAMDNTEKIDFVKRTYGVSFQYTANMPLGRLFEFLRSKARIESSRREPENWRYDLTVASGLMYHVNSPLDLLARLRAVTRSGGLVLLETAALRRPEHYMQYNFDGQRYVYGWSDTWFPSTSLLDHLLRQCRLQPLDVLHLTQDGIYPDLLRLAVVCRAVDDVVAGASEVFMRRAATNVDLALEADLEGDFGHEPLPFRSAPDGLVLRAGTGGCDIHATVLERRPHAIDEDAVRLRLAADR